MSATTQTRPSSDGGRSLAHLATGILDDLQELLEQHLKLFRAEVTEDLRRTREAVVWLTVGAVACGLGALLVLFMCVHLLALTDLPLWACFGIVGALVLGIGGTLFYHGKERLEQAAPVPEKTIEELKEDVRWAKGQP